MSKLKNPLDIKKFVLEIVQLTELAASGVDALDKGAVGYNGYGFVFRDSAELPAAINLGGNSKAFGVGSGRSFETIYEKHIRPLVDERALKSILDVGTILSHYNRHDRFFDLRLAGSLKTLFPLYKFGGFDEDQFFEVWFFAIMPDGRKFPAFFYWGRTGPAIGAYKYEIKDGKKVWKQFTVDYETSEKKKAAWPKTFYDVVNFTPQEYSISTIWERKLDEASKLKIEEDRELFCEAFELALLKVFPSDFEGVEDTEPFCDSAELIGLRKGVPFSEWVERDELKR